MEAFHRIIRYLSTHACFHVLDGLKGCWLDRCNFDSEQAQRSFQGWGSVLRVCWCWYQEHYQSKHLFEDLDTQLTVVHLKTDVPLCRICCYFCCKPAHIKLCTMEWVLQTVVRSVSSGLGLAFDVVCKEPQMRWLLPLRQLQTNPLEASSNFFFFATAPTFWLRSFVGFDAAFQRGADEMTFARSTL